MAVVNVVNTRYVTDPLYQWDTNQVLEIRGLSLTAIPEMHFSNATMGRAIVRQATMDASGVIRAEVPNSLLQKAHTVVVHVCTYAGDSFQSLYKIEMPIKARPKPEDYTLEDDDEVYSFNALENQVINALARCDEAEQAYNSAKGDMEDATTAAVDTILSHITPGDINAYTKDEVLAANTREALGLAENALPDAAFEILSRVNARQNIGIHFGTYSGTASSGEPGRVVLNVDFKPLLVAVGGKCGVGTSADYITVVIPRGTTLLNAPYYPELSSIKWESNSVSWSSSGAYDGLNNGGEYYKYVVIGITEEE